MKKFSLNLEQVEKTRKMELLLRKTFNFSFFFLLVCPRRSGNKHISKHYNFLISIIEVEKRDLCRSKYFNFHKMLKKFLFFFCLMEKWNLRHIFHNFKENSSQALYEWKFFSFVCLFFLKKIFPFFTVIWKLGIYFNCNFQCRDYNY